MKIVESTDRKASLLRLCPNIFKGGDTVLYIGAKGERIDFGKEFSKCGDEITIVEAFRENVLACRRMQFVSKVIHSDIRSFQPGKEKWDIVFWWHGPEHVYKSQIESSLSHIERMANKSVVLGCPWGVYGQGAVGGNEFEEHKATIFPKDFERLGYTVEALGKENELGSNITAVKYV